MNLLDRIYARPPLSWTVTAFQWIKEQTMVSWPRRTAIAAVVAAGYGLLGWAGDLPVAFAAAAVFPLLLLGVVPFERWQARRMALQMADLSQAAGRAGMVGVSADLAAAADRWRARAEATR